MNSVTTWDYATSVEKVRPMVMNWRTITLEIVEELYRAREELGARRPGKIDVPNETWTSYLDDVGLARTTVHRWLERYEPEERRLMEPDEVEERKRIADRAAQDAAVAQRKRVNEAISTGRKPDDWDDATEKAYQRELKERRERAERVDKAKEELDAERERREKKEEERKARQTHWDADHELLSEALNAAIDRQERVRGDLGLTGDDDDAQQAIYDAIEWHVGKADTDSRRIEVLQNIIKYCKRLVNEYQVKVSR